MTVSLIITQANDKTASNNARKASNHQLPDLLSLCLRGTRIEIDRDTLVNKFIILQIVVVEKHIDCLYIVDITRKYTSCHVSTRIHT